MRCDDPGQHPSLVQRFADEPDVTEAQIPQTAVDQLRRRRGGRAAEVSLVDEPDREPGARRRRGHTGADDPAADHEHVELSARKPLDCRTAPGYGHSGFVQARRPYSSTTSSRVNGTCGGMLRRAAVIPAVSDSD